MAIEWDVAKEAAMLLKSDAECLEIFDVEHSDVEERFISVGVVLSRVLVVVWTERKEATVRIISARPATQREIRFLRDYMEGAG